MALEKLEFSKSWENAEDFPTFESDEAQVRKDYQALHDETKDYINETLLPQMEQELDNKADDDNVLHKDEVKEYTPTQDNHPANKKYVDDVARQMSQGALPDQSVTPIKMADTFWDEVRARTVAKTGDTMTGPVRIETEEKPHVALADTTHKRDGHVQLEADGSLSLCSRAADDESDNGVQIVLNPEDTDLLHAAQMRRVKDGETADFDLLHTGNTDALGMAKMQSGSYVGTGTGGSENPNSLTFAFAPRLVIICSAGMHIQSPILLCEPLTTQYQQGLGFSSYGNISNSYAKRSEDGKTIFWYSTHENASLDQLNGSSGTAGYTYYFIAIG